MSSKFYYAARPANCLHDIPSRAGIMSIDYRCLVRCFLFNQNRCGVWLVYRVHLNYSKYGKKRSESGAQLRIGAAT